MSKRDSYMARMEAVKMKGINITPDEEKSNAVDTTVMELERQTMEDVEIPKKSNSPKPEKSDNNVVLNSGIQLDLKAREYKTVRKCFLISESLNSKFTSLAKNNGVSENELLNKILEQVFV